MTNKKAIILFSSGIDSTTCLAIAKSQGFSCYTLSFDYGQRHRVETDNAARLAKQSGVCEHLLLPLPMGLIRGSSLTDMTLDVPDHQEHDGIPNTYVPARNTIFLSFGLAWAEVLGATHIFYGANHVDYSGYADCRPAYIQAFENMAKLATKAGIETGQGIIIEAPLLYMNKADIIREGLRLGVDYSQTISCYRADQDGRACGRCDSCAYRKKGFEEAGVKDPTLYQ